jgi:hypothetical protein
LFAAARRPGATALASVAGVYLISDTLTGKLYVGSATGEGGIWGRWCQYVDGHGHNIQLKRLVGAESAGDSATARSLSADPLLNRRYIVNPGPYNPPQYGTPFEALVGVRVILE